MFKMTVDQKDINQMANNLQTSDADMYMALAKYGYIAVANIRSRIKERFPKRENAIKVEWDIGATGLNITVVSPSEGLMESVKEGVEEIVNDEIEKMAVGVQIDLARSVRGARIQ